MGVRSYRELKVWQASMDLTERVYRLTENFPRSEMYGLASQVQRAAVSIPSNLAEGHARDSSKEYLHHISIALGSLAEMETQLILASRLGYLTESEIQPALSLADEIGKMLRAIQKTLKSRGRD